MNFRRLIALCLSLVLLNSPPVGCRRVSPAAIPPRSELSIMSPIVELRAADDEQPSHQTAVIRVKNVGNVPVGIASVNTGCSCAAVNEVPQTPLEPGATVEIAIRVHLPEFGDQSVAVQIATTPQSDAPLRAELKLHGKPWPIPRLVYPLNDLRISGASGSTATKTFAVQTWEKPGSSPWLRGFEVDTQRCRLVMEEPPVEKLLTTELVERRYIVRVEVESEPSPNELQIATVIPNFVPPTASATPFRILIEQKSKIRAFPAVINVSRTSLPMKRQVLLTSDPSAWTCALDDDLPEWIRVTSIDDVSSPSQRALRLTLTISPPPERLSYSSSVTCVISDSEVGSILIPIHVHEK